MLKKTVKYTDFNGDPQVEDFYFNLTKAELVELEVSVEDGLSSLIKKIAASTDGNVIMSTFKDIIARSYGVRSTDGKSFIKTPEATLNFMGSAAYSEMFMDMVGDADKMSEFIRGIVPADLVKQIDSDQPSEETAEALKAKLAALEAKAKQDQDRV